MGNERRTGCGNSTQYEDIVYPGMKVSDLHQ